MSPPSFLIAGEKGVDTVARPLEGADPLAEQRAAGVGQLVDAFGRSRRLRVPARGDEALALERAQRAVEVAEVDALARRELLEGFHELVSVSWSFAKQEQERRLREAHHTRMDRPGPPSRPAVAAAPHRAKDMCEMHISCTTLARPA